MTNDAKLGMLAGVLGVLFAAVFLTNPGPPPDSAFPPPQAQTQPASLPSAPAGAPSVATSDAKPAALPSTPVSRVRKEVAAQPAGRHAVADEEP